MNIKHSPIFNVILIVSIFGVLPYVIIILIQKVIFPEDNINWSEFVLSDMVCFLFPVIIAAILMSLSLKYNKSNESHNEMKKDQRDTDRTNSKQE